MPLRDEFFSSVSHDLRAPVAAIKAAIGVVLANEPPGTSPAVRRLFGNIDPAADELARWVSDTGFGFCKLNWPASGPSLSGFCSNAVANPGQAAYDPASNYATQGVLPASGSPSAQEYCSETCLRAPDPGTPFGNPVGVHFAMACTWIPTRTPC